MKKKQLYIKNNTFFNKEGRQFRIIFLMYNAHCSLCFNSIRNHNECKGDPVFQGIFSMFKCIEH